MIGETAALASLAAASVGTETEMSSSAAPHAKQTTVDKAVVAPPPPATSEQGPAPVASTRASSEASRPQTIPQTPMVALKEERLVAMANLLHAHVQAQGNAALQSKRPSALARALELVETAQRVYEFVQPTLESVPLRYARKRDALARLAAITWQTTSLHGALQRLAEGQHDDGDATHRSGASAGEGRRRSLAPEGRRRSLAPEGRHRSLAPDAQGHPPSSKDVAWHAEMGIVCADGTRPGSEPPSRTNTARSHGTYQSGLADEPQRRLSCVAPSQRSDTMQRSDTWQRSDTMHSGTPLSAGGRRSSTCRSSASAASASFVTELVGLLLELGLEREVVETLERAVQPRVHGSAVASTSAVTSTLSSRSSGASSLAAEQHGLRRMLASLRLLGQKLAVSLSYWEPPILAARYLLPIYLAAAFVAPVSVLVPVLAYPLDIDDEARWSRCVQVAFWLDVLLVQPLLQLMVLGLCSTSGVR